MSISYHKAKQEDEFETERGGESWNKSRAGEPDNLKNTETGKAKVMEVLREKIRSCCTINTIKKNLPICKWLPNYNSDDLIGDAIAGLTVGLTVIPQGIAYALIAGLPPNYGLYSAFFGSFLYVFFGTCKDITIGPTAIMSILTHEYSDGNPELAVLLCFTSGIIILIFGIFKLGFLINFISKPVISGFTSAAAITIFTSQLKGLFGIKVSSHGLVDTWVQVITHIGETRWQDLTLGIICIVVLLLMRKLKELPQFKKRDDDTSTQRAYKMAIFLVSVGRNAIVVIIATAISAGLDSNQPFTITGYIKPGLPNVQLPPFTLNNGTTSFVEAMSEVGSGVIILPLIAILENIAIGSAFAHGKTIDASREMIALGICNFGNSFFQAYPTTGSFSRTAVNANSGVRTPAGGIVTGVIIVLALAILTPYFTYIPLSALAAVIICAVIFMIEYHDIKPIWRVRKADQLVLWVSFLVCIFWKLEYGIVLGALINLGIILIAEANPKIVVTPNLQVENGCPPYILIIPRTGLLYINVEKLRTQVTKAGIKYGQGTLPVVVDCSHFAVVDYSASRGMQSLCKDFKLRGQPVLFMNGSPTVRRALKALNPEINIVDEDSLAGALGDLQCSPKPEENSPQTNEEKNLIASDGKEPQNVTIT